MTRCTATPPPHPKGIELHGGALVLYGCGDFLNDYEGIGGNAAFRGDLSLMDFVTLEPAGCRKCWTARSAGSAPA